MTLMEQEAREAPAAAARFLGRNQTALDELGARLRASPPAMVLTSARGSSDHAAGFFKYLTEILTGTPCASIGASVVSVYGAHLRAEGALCLTVSQSGKSPDIVALQAEARRAGAFSVALVNVEDSPAATSADLCLPLCAGPERSVAATKSFIVSLAAGAAIAARWSGGRQMLSSVEELPQTLDAACATAWPAVEALLGDAESAYVLGRGPLFPVAAEVALKLKETCGIHAEAHSLAEVMHGPLELLGGGFPVLALVPDDAARQASGEALAKIRKTGAALAVVGEDVRYAAAAHPLLHGISIVQSAYLAIEAVARRRGRDPDRPRLLSKVTETV